MEIIAYMTLKSKHIHTHTYAAALKIKRDSTLGHADQAIPLEFNIFFEKNKQTNNEHTENGFKFNFFFFCFETFKFKDCTRVYFCSM